MINMVIATIRRKPDALLEVLLPYFIGTDFFRLNSMVGAAKAFMNKHM